ncbi:DUF262 domain-containing protein [Bergeyella porcorum]|uniref:DUF262 domain-containing protein n=1 Tax=Bergeyella porcorum TaxID=1735111 RepID=UPI0035EEAD2B
MKAEEKKLQEIFANQNVYEIPNYQRPYSWNQDNVSELISDTLDAFESQVKEYFIGSIITIDKTKEDKIFEVVDGQQRLTTLTIIFAGLRNLIKDEAVKSEIQKKILPINIFTDEPETPRLVVRNQDESFFYDHILLSKPLDKKVSITETKARFISNLETVENLLSVFDEVFLKKYTNYLLQNVFVVLVKTESFDSAYRLFTVLNARGLPLSNADLLKNLLFGRCKSEIEKQRVENLWNDLEDIIKIKNLDYFLSHYRTAIKGNKAQTDLFKEYNDYLKSNSELSSEEFCKKLNYSAKNYKKIIENNFENNGIKKIIYSLKNVSYDEWIPTLLAFLDKPINDFEFIDFAQLIEKITYQNWIRRLGRTQRNTVYYNVIILINKQASKNEVIEKIIEHKNNEEFFNILNSNLYGMSYAKAILLRLENGTQDDSVAKEFSGIISIEHILPQKATDDYWMKRFSEQEIFENVHKIGNLVLLSGKKNSQAQNYNFDRKKDIYFKKNEKVSFDLTKEILAEDEWTLDKINERQNKLIESAKRLWNI